MAVCSQVPDAIAVNDARGNLIGFDESAAHEYEAAQLGEVCGDECRAAGHLVLL